MHFVHPTAITMYIYVAIHMYANTRKSLPSLTDHLYLCPDSCAPFIMVTLMNVIIVVCIVSHEMVKSVHNGIWMIMQIINQPWFSNFFTQHFILLIQQTVLLQLTTLLLFCDQLIDLQVSNWYMWVWKTYLVYLMTHFVKFKCLL